MEIHGVGSPLTPWFGTPVQLESIEFNKQFKVFIQDAKDAFYQLDPDTMLDLLDLRQDLGFPISLEFTPNSILIYTNRKAFDRLLKNALSFTEILNGEPSETDITVYKKSITEMQQACKLVFNSLDLKANQVK